MHWLKLANVEGSEKVKIDLRQNNQKLQQESHLPCVSFVLYEIRVVGLCIYLLRHVPRWMRKAHKK
jgi:hypothetical protein